MKELHAEYFDGITFGMDIEPKSKAYAFFKKNIKREKCIDFMGNQYDGWVVPAVALGSIMKEAHWLVTELKGFNWVSIDGLHNDEHIYVKYDNEPIDFRTRLQKYL